MYFVGIMELKHSVTLQGGIHKPYGQHFGYFHLPLYTVLLQRSYLDIRAFPSRSINWGSINWGSINWDQLIGQN